MTNSNPENEEEKPEYVTVKFLLKQVYAAHVSKVKELESEIQNLQFELNKKDKWDGCPNCKEIESAYSACKEEYKNAVLEQTRKLKELEEKFASFDRKNKIADKQKPGTSKMYITENFSETLKLTENEINTVCLNVKENKNFQYYANATLDSIENFSQNPINLKDDEKIKDNCFLLSSDSKSCEEEFDTSAILVPETSDFIVATPQHNNKPENKNSLSPKSPQTKSVRGKENKGIENIQEKTKSPLKLCKKRNISATVTKEVKLNKNDDSSPKKLNEKKENHQSADLDINPKKKKLQKTKTNWSNNFKDFIDGNQSTNSVAPSKLKQKLNISDDDDFQSLNCVAQDSIQLWKTAQNKILPKKSSLKPMHSSSRFKMTFETHKKNHVKVNYKQTRLSLSHFQKDKTDSQDTNSNDSNSNCSEKNENFSKFFDNSSLAGLSELASLVDVPTPLPNEHINADATTLLRTEQIDPDAATCLPHDMLECSNIFLSNFETPSLLDHNKEGPQNVECKRYLFKDAKRNSQQNDVPDVLQKPLSKCENQHNIAYNEKERMLSSFDRPPVPEEPNYKYKEDPVRSKAKRKQLLGFECKECEKYYNELGLSEEEKKERLKQCSRHRAKYVPPETPEHFWDVDFPDTEECKLRGYQNETQPVKLQQRRRRPLEMN